MPDPEYDPEYSLYYNWLDRFSEAIQESLSLFIVVFAEVKGEASHFDMTHPSLNWLDVLRWINEESSTGSHLYSVGDDLLDIRF